MSKQEPFSEILKAGKKNSLGRTLEVVEIVLKDKSKLEELYQVYFQEDEWARLRTSNAFKRVFRQNPEWFKQYIDRFIDEVSNIDQPSAQWTAAQLLYEGQKLLSPQQKDRAIVALKKNLEATDDWIVINADLQALGDWAKDDEELANWLIPHLKKLLKDPHKSIARRSEKLLANLSQ